MGSLKSKLRFKAKPNKQIKNMPITSPTYRKEMKSQITNVAANWTRIYSNDKCPKDIIFIIIRYSFKPPLFMSYWNSSLYKLLLIGDECVGKSNLLLRFCDDSFIDEYIPTIGVDFKIRTVIVDGPILMIQCWDTAGQDRFRVIVSSYFRGAHGILLLFDITNKKSFDNLKSIWLPLIENNSHPSVEKVLIGTKYDLNLKRRVSKNVAKQFALTTGCIEYFEVSAKDDIGIKDPFKKLTKTLHDVRLTCTKRDPQRPWM